MLDALLTREHIDWLLTLPNLSQVFGQDFLKASISLSIPKRTFDSPRECEEESLSYRGWACCFSRLHGTSIYFLTNRGLDCCYSSFTRVYARLGGSHLVLEDISGSFLALRGSRHSFLTSKGRRPSFLILRGNWLPLFQLKKWSMLLPHLWW